MSRAHPPRTAPRPTDPARLWPQVRTLLAAPPAPDDAELRRAARLLASSRADALELLLARLLAAEAGTAAPAGNAPDAVEPTATDTAEAAPPSAAPAGMRGSRRLRDAALLGAGLAGGALIAQVLDDDAGLDALDVF